MTAALDRDVIARLIHNGRAQGLADEAIADQIVALAVDPTWAKAMSHPTRGVIIRLLREHGPLSPIQAIRLLEGSTTSLGSMGYHFRQLEKLELIEIAQRIPRRGAIEHVYRLIKT